MEEDRLSEGVSMKNYKFSATLHTDGGREMIGRSAAGGKIANFKIVLMLSLFATGAAWAEGEYCVQIWAQTQEEISSLSARAARYGKPLNISMEERWVQVARGASREEARALSQRLHQEEGLEAWVVSLSAQNGIEMVVGQPLNGTTSSQLSQSGFAQEGLAGERLASVLGDALTLLGTPYKFGGATLEEGLDCSSFVQLIFEAVGVEVPRNARSQYKIGEKIAKTDLQRGDLVFFKNTYRWGISHVGIYVGGGEFIHASAGKSRKVTVSNLSEPYYIRKYAGARRLF